MINLDNIKTINIKESSVLTKMRAEGENKMYQYLSGNDEDSSYTGENVKTVMNMIKTLDWNKVEDPSNALFSIGYSEQGNIIGILTNANALLQDMLLYCSLDEAIRNLQKVLNIGVGSQPHVGKRYAVNGKSPLTFALPVITSGGYKSYAVVIHNKHADEFIKILTHIDVNALTKEDILLIAKDISFLSRTQELAIDVAKDKTIQIVNTAEWLEKGVKPKNFWLSHNKKIGDWLATENLNEIIDAHNKGSLMPEFKIEDNTPDFLKGTFQVTTSESISKEVLKKATEDYFNSQFKDMLSYSCETELNIRCKSSAKEHKELSKAIKKVIIAYRSFMIDNMPKYTMEMDKHTCLLVNKESKDKNASFAKICRNTIYKLGLAAGLDFKTIAQVAYGTDLLEVAINDGKYFRAIMPFEFNKLYANGNTNTKQQKLYFVDELIQDDIDDGLDVIVDFVDGQAFDEDGVLIAKTSIKYNAKDAKLIFDDESGRFFAQTEELVSLPEITNEVLMQISGLEQHEIDDINSNPLSLEFTTKTPYHSNVLFIRDELNNPSVIANLGYMNHLSSLERAILLNNQIIFNMTNDSKFDIAQNGLDSFDTVNKYNLYNNVTLNNIITVNKNNKEFTTNYAVISL